MALSRVDLSLVPVLQPELDLPPAASSRLAQASLQLGLDSQGPPSQAPHAVALHC
jgi:hypothetical protein